LGNVGAWLKDKAMGVLLIIVAGPPFLLFLTGVLTLADQIFRWLKLGVWQHHGFWAEFFAPYLGHARPHFDWAVPDRLLQGIWEGELWLWTLVLGMLVVGLEIILFYIGDAIYETWKKPPTKRTRLWMGGIAGWMIVVPALHGVHSVVMGRSFWSGWKWGMIVALAVGFMLIGLVDWLIERSNKSAEQIDPPAS
jgi:hypothetical protein